MRGVEQVVDDRVLLEHDVVHPARDLRALSLDDRGGGLQDVDGVGAECWSHCSVDFLARQVNCSVEFFELNLHSQTPANL